MNILLTSVGRRAYMINYFKNALKGRGCVHAMNSHFTYALQVADTHEISPHIFDKSYIKFLLKYCVENNISAIVSLFDIDLPILASHREEFSNNGIKIIVSDLSFVRICNDKWATNLFLKKNGFAVPKTYLTLGDVKKNLDSGLVDYPIIIKPRWGMGSIGINFANNEEELNFFYSKTKNEIINSYLKFESTEDFENSIIFQEVIQGQEYGIDIFNDFEGNYIVSVPKIKLEMRSGETNSAKVIKNKNLNELGKKIGEITKHIGNLDIDIFVKEDGTIIILEMNSRFGGQYPFSHLAGVNFPKVIVDLLRQSDICPEDITYVETEGFKNLEPVIIRRKYGD